MTGGKDGGEGTREAEGSERGSDNEASGKAAPPSESKKPCVLLVEDDPSFARSMRRLLSAKYDTVHFENGEAALQAIMERSFDVVVSDIHMPGMTGVELLS